MVQDVRTRATGPRGRCPGGSVIPALLLSVILSLPSTTALLAADPPSTLERIEYRRDGTTHSAIGEVTIASDRVRLRFFSDVLASHYEVWVPLDDFISAKPLSSPESAALLVERERAVARREAERAARAAAREKAREEARESTRAGRLAATREGRAERSSTSRSDEGTDSGEATSVRRTPASTEDLQSVHDDLEDRRRSMEESASRLHARVDGRLSDARATRHTLRKIQTEVEEVLISLGRVVSRLEMRAGTVERIREESAAGSVRGSELGEWIEAVSDQYDAIDRLLDRAAKEMADCERSFAAVPAEQPAAIEEPPAPEPGNPSREATERSPRPAVSSPVSAPASATPPAPRSDDRTSGSTESREVAREGAEDAEDAEETRSARSDGSDGSDGSDAGAAEERAVGEGGSNPSSGGPPGWLVYPLGALSLLLLWRGARRGA